MLPGGTDGMYRAALGRSIRLYTRVDVSDGAGNPLPIPAEFTDENGGIVYTTGAITATLMSRVTRTLRLTVPQQLYAALPTDLLAPYGHRVTVTQGVQWADGNLDHTWVTFTGRIQRPVLDAGGLVTFTAADRAYEVIEAGFLVPESSQIGNPVSAEFRRLVSDVVPDAVFGASDFFPDPMPDLTWEWDRGLALDEISTSVGACWYTLANGDYVQRRYPWTVPGAPVVILRDGVDGILFASPSRNRDEVWNSITVSGERADGTAPVYAIAEDTNPDSPTYVDGPFGRRHKSIPLQTPQTQGTAQTAANAYLRRSVALQETWSWEQPLDASMELGDVVGIEAYGRTGIVQVVSGFTLPLDTSTTMRVQAHPQVIGVLQ